MLMLDDNMLNKEWIQELDDAHFRMWISILLLASRKTGIFEANMRNINFMANTSKKFSREDLLRDFNGMIQVVPDHTDKMIVTEYIRHNWLKDGRELDPSKNRLDKAIVKELGQYGLTIERLNEMAKHKIKEVCCGRSSGDDDSDEKNAESRDDSSSSSNHRTVSGIASLDVGLSAKDADEMFNAFWAAYPGPRKQDKKKCFAKFVKIIGTDQDKAVSMFNRIMDGVEKWKKTDCWSKDGGRYVCAPLVWLNNERWDAEITEATNGNSKQHSGTANTNYKTAEADGIF